MRLKDNPLVSVIMPVYNGEKYLADAIDSILNQSFTDFEFIIINDGSVDRSEEIILSYSDPRIIYRKNEANIKLIKTLNSGVDIAKGKYIARMDADDISLPKRFEMQLSAFENLKDIDVVNIEFFLLQDDGSKFRERKYSIVLSPQAIKYLIVLENFICHPGVMVKAQLLKKYKYIDKLALEHIEDFDLWNRMLEDGCVCHTIPDNLIYYRRNPTSINQTQKDIQMERMLSLCLSNLQNRFDFKMKRDSLLPVLREDALKNVLAAKEIEKDLKSFVAFVTTKYSLSKSVHDEMKLWKRQKILLLSLKSIIACPMHAKFGICIFLLRRLTWFRDRHLRLFVQKTISSNYTRRH